MRKTLLSSGNSFYYWKETNDQLACGWIISTNEEFVGGFLGKEADRKFAAFSKLSNTVVTDCDEEEGYKALVNSSKDKFAEKMGAVSTIFKEAFDLLVKDLNDCDGTSSTAESCDERKEYYDVVGCSAAFKTNKAFLLGLFVANHVSIFSWNHFRETFFKGKENPDKDDFMNLDKSWAKWVYAKKGFKAPAAYVRALANNK